MKVICRNRWSGKDGFHLNKRERYKRLYAVHPCFVVSKTTSGFYWLKERRGQSHLEMWGDNAGHVSRRKYDKDVQELKSCLEIRD